MARVTLQQVSERAGVSRSTASLVVQDSDSIPERTKARVRAAMAELGYVYNVQAASLRQQTSKTIGLIATEIENPYFAMIAMAFEDRLARDDYTLLVGYTRDDRQRQDRLSAHSWNAASTGCSSFPPSARTSGLCRRPWSRRGPNSCCSRVA